MKMQHEFTINVGQELGPTWKDLCQKMARTFYADFSGVLIDGAKFDVAGYFRLASWILPASTIIRHRQYWKALRTGSG